MLVLVSLPGSVVIELDASPKDIGQECLDQLCAKMNVIEVDYFGLQYTGRKGETLWLNLRNPLNAQLTGPPPFRLQLRVKFFVQPHLVLQETARHIFYLHVKNDLSEGKLDASTVQAAKLCALIAQAESGDYSKDKSQYNFYPHYIPNWPTTFSTNVVMEHRKLAGMNRGAAEYRVLQEASACENFGMEYHEVRNNVGQPMKLGVGPNGLTIYEDDYTFVQSVSFALIKMATHTNKCFFLTILGPTGDTMMLGFKLMSTKAAEGLYRAVTEKHAFYRCETVRQAVRTQYSRDFKGTIVALFNDKTNLGKKYVFDIQRTCREVYDHARRLIHSTGKAISLPSTPTMSSSRTSLRDRSFSDSMDSLDSKQLREKLRKIQESMLCKVCMDADISTAFCPCGHLVCCGVCAACCDKCPLCRSSVEHTQHIFLPSSTDMNEIEE
ncbi:E3 ubiquitin-protein ligase MYLIP-like [Saccoglossus kowalevskii]|uniref:RING-type E3 ubiquitin transferase n=1 Tax=Saccoglossus kowalevskii TaxID=10224 RepID=A0ABM0GNF8_SACKO|nr:PREDICTED: E3 ubiquitin-protein ligase MYLIP-like [Saccoglossus kowalevskii]